MKPPWITTSTVSFSKMAFIIFLSWKVCINNMSNSNWDPINVSVDFFNIFYICPPRMCLFVSQAYLSCHAQPWQCPFQCMRSSLERSYFPGWSIKTESRKNDELPFPRPFFCPSVGPTASSSSRWEVQRPPKHFNTDRFYLRLEKNDLAHSWSTI